MADAERCVICGAVVPEGRQVCPQCSVGFADGWLHSEIGRIKQGLKCHSLSVSERVKQNMFCGTSCPYGNMTAEGCSARLCADALTLITMLEKKPYEEDA